MPPGGRQAEGLRPLNDEAGERGASDAVALGEGGLAQALDVHEAGGETGGIKGEERVRMSADTGTERGEDVPGREIAPL